MPLPKLTKAVHDKLVETASSGCTIKACAELLGINPGTLRRWLSEGRNPDNKRQSALREDILRARARAEVEALKNIKLAGTDSDNWRASAWFLEHSIRGRYLRNAMKLRPITNITLSDVAREIGDETPHSESNGQPEEVISPLSERPRSFFTENPGMDNSGSE